MGVVYVTRVLAHGSLFPMCWPRLDIRLTSIYCKHDTAQVLLLQYTSAMNDIRNFSSGNIRRRREQGGAPSATPLIPSFSPLTGGLLIGKTASYTPSNIMADKANGKSSPGDTDGDGALFKFSTASASAAEGFQGNSGGVFDRSAAGWREGRRGGGGGGGASMDEKIVARTLECLDTLCRNEKCEQFMTPLAREVRFFGGWLSGSRLIV